GGADLDHVGAVLDDFAHLVLHRLDAVGHALGLMVILEGQQVVVAVSAGDAHRRAAHQHTRAGQRAFVDYVTQGDVGIAAGANVADGGEPGLQRGAGVHGAVQRLARRRDAKLRVTEVVRVHGDVRVRVDQTRQHGEVRQADDLGCRDGRFGADGGDLFAFDGDGL